MIHVDGEVKFSRKKEKLLEDRVMQFRPNYFYEVSY